MDSRINWASVAVILFAGFASPTARADAVTDWNAHWDEAVLLSAQPAPGQARSGAILHVAIFDAVNGVAGKYTPYYVAEPAPPGAREEAAAIQAAHTVLRALYPAQAGVLDAHLEDSLAGIPGAEGHSQSIAQGQAWGLYVATRILEFRSDDGWSTPPPPDFGGTDPGEWRSIPVGINPDGSLPAVFKQVAYLTPFGMETSDQFLPGPPYAPTLAQALASPQYAADVNEVKDIGAVNSATRTADQTRLAQLWQAIGPVDENRAARSVVPAGNKLVDNARLFALLNIASCDALTASMNSKFEYNLWRPHHAVRLADTDDNPATVADPTWTALVLAPRFPEYVANHACVSTAMMRMLESLLGDEHTFVMNSPNYPGFSWTFERFSDAGSQAGEARIWGGIHYRTSCDIGSAMGRGVADYVVERYLLPLH